MIVRNAEVRVIEDDFSRHKMFFERREEGVAGDVPLDQGEEEIRAQRKRLRINLGTAADEHIAAFVGGIDL